MVKDIKEKTKAEAKKVIRKKFSGVVVSNKNDKTIIVEVERVKMNKKYKKRYTVTKEYKVHDEKNVSQVGDKVSFVECRPLSKDKKWRLV